MITIGIVGGTGYTGVELLRLLAQHPEADVRVITSRKDAGTRVDQMFQSLRGRYDLAFCDPPDAPLAACNVVFFATPPGVEIAQARALLARAVATTPPPAPSRPRSPPLSRALPTPPRAALPRGFSSSIPNLGARVSSIYFAPSAGSLQWILLEKFVAISTGYPKARIESRIALGPRYICTMQVIAALARLYLS